MLMDSVEEKADDDNVEIEKRHSQSDSAEVDVFADASDHKEPSLGDLDSLNEFDTVPEKPVSSAEDGFTAAVKKVENEEKIERERKTTAVKSQSTNLDSGDDLESDGKPLVDPEEVLIINVMAPNGVRFAGEDLLEVLVAQGMKLGAMDIFHRHLNDDGDGPILFSLANMVVPGTFNLAAMKDFETPGVSIFLSLPLAAIDENGGVPEGLSIQAYDNMASTAKALAAALGGDLKDENRSVMTLQTIEHGRQRVVEFERKQRLARA
jgi:cell division protein ZipA